MYNHYQRQEKRNVVWNPLLLNKYLSAGPGSYLGLSGNLEELALEMIGRLTQSAAGGVKN